MSTTVDLGKITASVTVGTTTTGAAGTNASVSNSGTTQDAVLNFTIPRGEQGVQGQQGSTGPAGPAGPTGPQGPMGDVAVITPDQQTAFTMYSVPGQNTNGPMTQKATTDAIGNMQGALDEIAEEIVISESELINYTRIENFVFNASQSRYEANNNYVTKYIPVKKGCIYRGTFQCSASSEYWATAAFATSLPAANVSGVRVASVSSKNNNTATYEYKAEEDGYLTISHSDTTSYTFTTTFTLIGSALKDKVVIDSERIDEINDVINSEIINYTRIEKFVFNASTSKYGSNNGYVTKYIPVKAGKKYNVSFKCSASSDYWATIAFATSLPANNVSGTLLHQYSSKNNNTVSYLYSATTDGYLTISHSNTTSYTFTTVFTESAEGVDAYAKAKLIVTGADVVLIYRLWPLKIVIPKTSYVIYEDKCVLLSDYYSANIELSLSGLQSDVIKVVYDSSTHSVYRKDVASAMSAFEHELFTVDFTSGRVSLEEGTYRYNGLLTTQPTARTYYGKKIEFTGEQLFGYTALNFGYPVLNGNDYNDGQNSNPMNGIAIYGNEMFVLYQRGWIQVYDITNILNVTLKGSFQLESAMEHPNTAQFAPTVREGETYPLLYVASGVDSPYTEVEQIRYSNGEYTSENVQRINLTGYGSHPLMNTIIGDDGYFWAIGSKGTANDTFYYYKFNLPSLEQTTVNVDCGSAIESWTDTKTYASEPKVQGLCIHQRKSFQVLGALEGVNEIHVTDLSTHEVMTDIVLTDYDYSNMQGCAVYKGTLIISRNACKGFTMLVFD